MSLLFDLVIEPKKSKNYIRLVSSVYLFTLILVINSSIYLFFKLILIGYIIVSLILEWNKRSPCIEIKKIHLHDDKWILEKKDGTQEYYIQATILISNFLFSLMQLTDTRRKKLIILFNDQLSLSQLRLLHIKTQNNHIDV